MSTSTAMAGVAAANASLAASSARKAKIATCEVTMPTYEHQAATTQQAQSYAECVRLINPTEMSGAEILLVKTMIVCAIGLCAGCVWKNRHSDGHMMFFGGLAGLLGGAFLPPALVGIWVALKFLFS